MEYRTRGDMQIHTHSFPTRRSSDLLEADLRHQVVGELRGQIHGLALGQIDEYIPNVAGLVGEVDPGQHVGRVLRRRQRRRLLIRGGLREGVDLGGRRIIKKKQNTMNQDHTVHTGTTTETVSHTPLYQHTPIEGLHHSCDTVTQQTQSTDAAQIYVKIPTIKA